MSEPKSTINIQPDVQAMMNSYAGQIARLSSDLAVANGNLQALANRATELLKENDELKAEVSRLKPAPTADVHST